MSKIVIDHKNNLFCAGPCNDCSDNNYLKPYNGGRYEEYIYPLLNGDKIIIKNVCICSECNNRYFEFHDEELYENLNNDGIIILKKLIKMNVATFEVKDYINNKLYD